MNNKFDLQGFLHGDVVSCHPAVERDLHSRIVEYCKTYHKNESLNDSTNPFIIADIGCGDGQFTTNLISSHVIPMNIKYITKYLIDPNCQLENDTQNGIFSMTAAEFVTKCPSNHCDIIISKYVCHLLPQFDMFLKECQRILKPNGILFIVLASYKLDFTHYWGKIVQQVYDKQRKSSAHNWVRRDNHKVISDVGAFTVNHFHLSQSLTLNHKQARDFVKYRSWSSLQSVNQSVIDAIFSKNANKDEIDLVFHWSVSEVYKQCATKTISKL